MNISYRNRCVFFHIPRTGGRSIATLDWWAQWSGHFPRAAEVFVPNGFLSFAFVRNPWDRFLSAWAYYATMGVEHPFYPRARTVVASVKSIGGFRDFCHEFPSWRYRSEFLWWPQTYWLKGFAGQILGEFVGRYEGLQIQFDAIAEILGVEPVELPRVNAAKHAPYTDAFDNWGQGMVGELYSEDVEQWGYRFGR